MNIDDLVIYQIYPKSFADTNGDGIGDLNGIRRRLPYLADLGVNCLWLTPVFSSPMKDNGYDISDYYAIDPIFGTMDDLTSLIREAGSYGIGLMLDMVFNHTSTQHPWFQQALAGDTAYQDYYIFRDGDADTPPTNWVSKFGGSAWEYVPSLKKWYLHLFDVSQADLNWENPAVREELKKVIRFWSDKGVTGFRFDVVNLISKPELLEDDFDGDGRRFYTDGPHVHPYLKELVADTGLSRMVTVGELSSTSMEACAAYADPLANELSMCFHFHHLKVDYANGDKWQVKDADVAELTALLSAWQLKLQEIGAKDALFWSNHDQPRIASRFTPEKYADQAAKSYAVLMYYLRGIPYIFQGEELGMRNAGFTDISEYRDVESLNYYRILKDAGMSDPQILSVLSARSRDNSRTPMRWDASAHCGFTTGSPWIGIGHSDLSINAEAEAKDPNSVLSFFKRMIALRKGTETLKSGDISFPRTLCPSLFLYERHLKGETLFVLVNLSEEAAPLSEEEYAAYKDFSILLTNATGYPGLPMTLEPYECFVGCRKEA